MNIRGRKGETRAHGSKMSSSSRWSAASWRYNAADRDSDGDDETNDAVRGGGCGTGGSSDSVPPVTLRFVGGCVVPVMFHPESQLPVVVLAAEPKKSRLGRAFLEWDAFGGKVEPQESVEAAAAREFYEESMGIVELPESPTASDLCRALVQRKYLGRVTLSYLRGRAPTYRFTLYVVFFVRATWDMDLPAKFASLRSHLLLARTCFRSLQPPPVFDSEAEGDGNDNGNGDRPRFVVEDTPCPWLKRYATRSRPGIAVSILDAGIVLPAKFACLYGVCNGCFHRSPACVRKYGCFATSLCIRVKISDGREVTRSVPCTNKRQLHAYLDWVHDTLHARGTLATLPAYVRAHPATQPHTVLPEFLEKRRLRYLTLPQILDAHVTTSSQLLPAGLNTVVTGRVQTATRLWLRALSDAITPPQLPAPESP